MGSHRSPTVSCSMEPLFWTNCEEGLMISNGDKLEAITRLSTQIQNQN